MHSCLAGSLDLHLSHFKTKVNLSLFQVGFVSSRSQFFVPTWLFLIWLSRTRFLKISKYTSAARCGTWRAYLASAGYLVPPNDNLIPLTCMRWWEAVQEVGRTLGRKSMQANLSPLDCAVWTLTVLILETLRLRSQTLSLCTYKNLLLYGDMAIIVHTLQTLLSIQPCPPKSPAARSQTAMFP